MCVHTCVCACERERGKAEPAPRLARCLVHTRSLIDAYEHWTIISPEQLLVFLSSFGSNGSKASSPCKVLGEMLKAGAPWGLQQPWVKLGCEKQKRGLNGLKTTRTCVESSSPLTHGGAGLLL